MSPPLRRWPAPRPPSGLRVVVAAAALVATALAAQARASCCCAPCRGGPVVPLHLALEGTHLELHGLERRHDDGVSLEGEPDRRLYGLDDRVVLRFTVRNRSPRAVILSHSDPPEQMVGISAYLEAPAGSLRPPRWSPTQTIEGSVEAVRLAPGDVYGFEIEGEIRTGPAQVAAWNEAEIRLERDEIDGTTLWFVQGNVFEDPAGLVHLRSKGPGVYGASRPGDPGAVAGEEVGRPLFGETTLAIVDDARTRAHAAAVAALDAELACVRTELILAAPPLAIGSPMPFRLELVNDCDEDLVYDDWLVGSGGSLWIERDEPWSGGSWSPPPGPVLALTGEAPGLKTIAAGARAVLLARDDLLAELGIDEVGDLDVRYVGRGLRVGRRGTVDPALGPAVFATRSLASGPVSITIGRGSEARPRRGASQASHGGPVR